MAVALAKTESRQGREKQRSFDEPRPGTGVKGITYLLIRLYNTGKSRQGARPKLRELDHVEASAELTLSRKEFAALKLKKWPGFFLQEYPARSIHETNKSIIVRLECPPVAEVVTFEVSKMLPLSEPRISSQHSQRFDPASAAYRNAAYAASLRAFAWRCHELEERLQFLEVSGLLKEKGEPSGPPAKTKQAVEAEQQAQRSPQSSGKARALKLERLQDKRGKKPAQQITDRDRDMARLAFEEQPPLAIAVYLDDCNYPTPKTWRTPKFAPKGEKYETGIRVSRLRKSFCELISKAKRKHPIPAPDPN